MVVASISGSVDRAFTVFFAWVPALVGAIVVLLLGWLLARVIAKLVERASARAGFDRALHSGPGGGTIRSISDRPSRLLGAVVFWAILLSAVSLAASVLHIKALTAFVGAVWAYLPNVIAALAIFIIAGLIATAAARLAGRVMGDTGLGRVVGTGVPILVMTIATFMILNQLKIAPAIVTITYAALLGAIALGSALAFGLGGRDVAARMLEGAYGNVQANGPQWKHDLDQALARGKHEARAQTGRGTRASEAETRQASDGADGHYSVSGAAAAEIDTA
jgi:hypothetical protein